MPSTKSHISFLFTLLAIVWGVLIAANTLRAQWSSPTAIPPGNNPASFLTTGINPESKSGVLTLTNNFYVIGSGLVGKVGIGTSTIESSSRLVVEPYTNASIDAGAGSIRTSWQAAHNDDVINKSYLTSTLNASIDSIKYWTLSGNNLYASSTAYNIAIGTTTAGTAKLAVMGGNVGIGTTTPELPLDVNGNVRIGLSNGTTLEGNADWSKGDFSIKPFDNISASQFGWTYYGSGTRAGDIVTTGYGYAPNPNRVFAFRDGAVGVDRMVINVLTGNVGIGTTAPGLNASYIPTRLHVYSNSMSGTAVTIENASSTGLLGTELLLKSDNATRGNGVIMYNTGDKKAWGVGTTYGGSGKFQIGYVSDYTAQGAFQETETLRGDKGLLTILSTGNVGIGTTTPTVSLQVNGYAIANTPTHISHLATKGYVDTAAQSLWVNSGSYLYASSTSWRVGIGTTSPASALHIYPQNDIEGLRVVSSNYSPLVISTAAGVDLFRVNQSGDVTAVTSSATRMRSNNYCDADGDNCFDPSSGWSSAGYFATVTTATYSGNNNNNPGYAFAHARCNDQLAGTHVCSAEEILNTIRENDPNKPMPTVDVWIFNGPPGYTAMANDCDGRRSNIGSGTNTAYGSYWQMSDIVYLPHGRGLLYTCEKSLRFACCR